ncbi:MAG TPA: alpha/beta fold hydrolase [Nakamurella multipartita]|nr:alpha/beta fold hydrolase [Nakamurella multipartita]
MAGRKSLRVQTRTVHGHRRAYVLAGRGPALLLLHGVGCDHHTWDPVIEHLSRRYTVIAPDLLGHGDSAKPRADYSLGGFANGMRDLLAILGIDRVTVVGHSFGGGVAMQFAYQFPQYAERLVMVAPGGLGPEVNPILRGLTLPGGSTALAVAATPPVYAALRLVGGRAHAIGLPGTADIPGALGVLKGKADPAERDAFLHVLRAVVDWKGQVVSMTDRAYLAREMPTCLVWGSRDTVLPVVHAQRARAVIPAARIEVITGAGHFPHEEKPDQFVEILDDFIAATAPSVYDAKKWRTALRRGRAGEAARVGLRIPKDLRPEDLARAPEPARTAG